MSFINVIRGWIFYLCLSVSIICLTVGVLVSLPFTSVKWRYDVFGRNWAKLVLWMLAKLDKISETPVFSRLADLAPIIT